MTEINLSNNTLKVMEEELAFTPYETVEAFADAVKNNDADAVYRLCVLGQTPGLPDLCWEELLERAAELGSSEAEDQLADFLYMDDTDDRFGKDKKRAVELYKKSAEAGNVFAVLSLGCHYLDDRMPDHDRDMGIEYLQKAGDSSLSIAAVVADIFWCHADYENALPFYMKGRLYDEEGEMFDVDEDGIMECYYSRIAYCNEALGNCGEALKYYKKAVDSGAHCEESVKRLQAICSKREEPNEGHSSSLRSLTDVLREYKKICWYPSAGSDFRELLFLSEAYLDKKQVPMDKEELPDLFLLTDCHPSFGSYGPGHSMSEVEMLNWKFPEALHMLFMDSNRVTKIEARSVEPLFMPEIRYHERFYSSDLSPNYGQAFLMKVHVTSELLGEWDTDMVYVLTENTGFAMDYLLKNDIPVHTLVRVRYGEGFGGSRISSGWLEALLRPLHVKYYLSSYGIAGEPVLLPGEFRMAFKNRRDIVGNPEPVPAEEFYTVDSKTWSNCGDVHWYRVQEALD